MKKRIIIITIITFVTCLLIWRFWPHSFSSIIPVDVNSVISFSACTSVAYVEDGEPYIDTYCLDISQQQDDSIEEIIKILEASEYQQDYRNILPWSIDYVDTDRNFDGHTATLLFVFGNKKDDCISIQFLSRSIIIVSIREEPGFRIFHPTNPETLYDLVEYFQTYGAMQ